jgi:hypothetical protein
MFSTTLEEEGKEDEKVETTMHQQMGEISNNALSKN